MTTDRKITIQNNALDPAYLSQLLNSNGVFVYPNDELYPFEPDISELVQDDNPAGQPGALDPGALSDLLDGQTQPTLEDYAPLQGALEALIKNIGPHLDDLPGEIRDDISAYLEKLEEITDAGGPEMATKIDELTQEFADEMGANIDALKQLDFDTAVLDTLQQSLQRVEMTNLSLADQFIGTPDTTGLNVTPIMDVLEIADALEDSDPEAAERLRDITSQYTSGEITAEEMADALREEAKNHWEFVEDNTPRLTADMRYTIEPDAYGQALNKVADAVENMTQTGIYNSPDPLITVPDGMFPDYGWNPIYEPPIFDPPFPGWPLAGLEPLPDFPDILPEMDAGIAGKLIGLVENIQNEQPWARGDEISRLENYLDELKEQGIEVDHAGLAYVVENALNGNANADLSALKQEFGIGGVAPMPRVFEPGGFDKLFHSTEERLHPIDKGVSFENYERGHFAGQANEALQNTGPLVEVQPGRAPDLGADNAVTFEIKGQQLDI